MAASTLALGAIGSLGARAADRAEVIELPPPRTKSTVSLEETLRRRRSVRRFEDRPLSRAELGQLLWAAQGITEADDGFRTSPSAGALFPLEIYACTAEGVLHYRPRIHSVQVSSHRDVRRALSKAALGQEAVRRAPAVFVITAFYPRTAKKYGAQRAVRYAQLEAGHAAQNLLLQAAALDLGGVPIGAFEDRPVQEALGIPEDHRPLYLVPVGRAED